jgi:hypothetical protein
MAVSRALRRLLLVLEMEEEQGQLALKSALSELRRLEQLATSARTRERSGRQLVVRSAYTGELSDRLAGLEEARGSAKRAAALEIKIVQAMLQVAALRGAYLAKRVERRQAEMLISEAEAGDVLVSTRRSQQGLDDWYLNRLIARKAGAVESYEGLPKDLTEKVKENL